MHTAMHTVYHRPDGRILGVLSTPDPAYVLTLQLAGERVQSFETDEFVDADPEAEAAKVRAACEHGRVVSGRVEFAVAAVATGAAPDVVELAVSRAIEKLVREGKITVAAPAATSKKKVTR